MHIAPYARWEALLGLSQAQMHCHETRKSCAGGLDLEGKFRNDAFIVDPRSCRWFGLGGIIKNAPPKPRAYHT